MIGESCDATSQAHAMGIVGLAWGMGTVGGTLSLRRVAQCVRLESDARRCKHAAFFVFAGPLIGGLLSHPCRHTSYLPGCSTRESLFRKRCEVSTCIGG